MKIKEICRPFKRKQFSITLFDDGTLIWKEGRNFERNITSLGVLRLREGAEGYSKNPPSYIKSSKEKEEFVKAQKEIFNILTKSVNGLIKEFSSNYSPQKRIRTKEKLKPRCTLASLRSVNIRLVVCLCTSSPEFCYRKTLLN